MNTREKQLCTINFQIADLTDKCDIDISLAQFASTTCVRMEMCDNKCGKAASEMV